MGGAIRAVGSQGTRGGEPPRVAPHHLQDEGPPTGRGHGIEIQPHLPYRSGEILCSGAKTRAAIGVHDVVVDGLGHADHRQRVATIPGRGLNLPTGLHRAIAAVVEEETNVVGRQDRKQAVVLGGVALFRVEIETAGPECSARCAAQACKVVSRNISSIDQSFPQYAQDAVACRQHPADPSSRLAGSGDHPGRGGIDHRRHTTRLGI